MTRCFTGREEVSVDETAAAVKYQHDILHAADGLFTHFLGDAVTNN